MKRKLLFSTIFLFICISLSAQKSKTELVSAKGKPTKLPYAQMALSAKLLGAAVSDTAYFSWCVSPLKYKGQYHLFSSRWPAKTKMAGWTSTSAEIIHLISDKPQGPFKNVGVILNTKNFPDSLKFAGPHNPRLEQVDGKFVMLYITQNPSEGILVGMRVGMMIADKIEGPWRFAGGKDGVMVEASKDSTHWTYKSALGTDNPAFMKIGQKYYIYFKAGMPKQLSARYGYAVSDKLEGPYVKCNTPITDNTSYIEDAQVFKCDGKYYMLTTDNLGGNTGIFGAIILWESATGLDFKLKDAKIALGTLYDYWGNEKQWKELLDEKPFIHNRSGKMERPAILLEKGKPAYFYAAGDININGGKMSEAYVFKIDSKNWNKSAQD
jgi:predicted GH43/DUF377 family glycosyl hydrolase